MRPVRFGDHTHSQRFFYESGQKILVENLATVSKPRCQTDRLRIAKTRFT
jgi:hypothetical protein